jgi:predicted membrane-bound spermidine synthase
MFSKCSIHLPRAMANIKDLGSTAIYAYTTLISVVICLPLALLMEGPKLAVGTKNAIASVGKTHFYGALLGVGLLYHLYN